MQSIQFESSLLQDHQQFRTNILETEGNKEACCDLQW